ncbi:alanine racemase [Blautia sp. MSJ-19]|uniref:alanine racemase n=1 Tax=Blautia sp. MSJ-19 TaxID=2841517 RepID=UPI001C0E9717|nr:alanine racemase [Blautia sp. MSJ-19]MBU5481538.1 alanine racemase [Blautia sp. MSJ-19]
MKKFERVKAVVSLDAIAHNFEEMKKNIADGTQIVAVIKADGYGHGAEAIARLVEGYKYIWGFATATAEEAIQLKDAGIQKPVLILGLVFEEYFRDLIKREVRMAVCEYEMAAALSQEAVRQGRQVHIHIGLDTGMSRIGFADKPESVEVIKKIAALPNVEIEGLFTHFARADETDKAPAVEQLDRYQEFVKLLEKAGVQIPMKHCSNSAGIIRMPEANLNAVRAGITIYGLYPSDEVERDIVKLIPAMELKSHISYVKDLPAGTPVSYGGTFASEKDLRVATIPVGYADGYPRSLSNKGWVLIHGQKAPILGRVCMDQFMVDVTHIPDVKHGDEVTLIGNDGEECISMETFGDLSGRFSYEFACDISKRVPRVYIKDGREWGDLTFFE